MRTKIEIRNHCASVINAHSKALTDYWGGCEKRILYSIASQPIKQVTVSKDVTLFVSRIVVAAEGNPKTARYFMHISELYKCFSEVIKIFLLQIRLLLIISWQSRLFRFGFLPSVIWGILRKQHFVPTRRICTCLGRVKCFQWEAIRIYSKCSVGRL